MDSRAAGSTYQGDCWKIGQARRRREVVKHIDRCLSCLACMTTCRVGRELHASGRSGAGAIEKEFKPADGRSHAARRRLGGCCRPETVPGQRLARGLGPALGRAFWPEPKNALGTPSPGPAHQGHAGARAGKLPARDRSAGSVFPLASQRGRGVALLQGWRAARFWHGMQSGRHQCS